MELRNLHTFLQIVDSGSFIKAADQLGYTQSTVSFQIKQLEDELGCRLFDRIGKKVTLTANGEKLVNHATMISDSVEKLTEDFKKTETPSGTVRIFSADSICEKMMSLHYQEFYRQFPNIKLVFSAGDTVDLLKVLDRNETDVIFTLDNHIYSKDYIIVGESPVQLHFVTNVKNPIAKQTGLKLSDLTGCPFLLTEKNMSYRKILDGLLAERSLEINPVLETGRTDIICRCLKDGNAVSFLPDFVTDAYVRGGSLVRLEVTDVNLTIWKQLICRRDKWISKALAEFLEYVKNNEFTW